MSDNDRHGAEHGDTAPVETDDKAPVETDGTTPVETDGDRTLRFVPEVEPSTVHRIVRTGVALAGLLFVLGLATVLPGVERLVAALAVPPLALALAVGSLLIVAAMLWVAPTVERAVSQALDGPAGAVADAAASAKLLVGFLAVVVAYNGLAPLVTHLIGAFDVPTGLYDLAFLVVGLLVLGAFARRLARCWDPVSRLLTDHVLEATGARWGDDDRFYIDR